MKEHLKYEDDVGRGDCFVCSDLLDYECEWNAGRPFMESDRKFYGYVYDLDHSIIVCITCYKNKVLVEHKKIR